MPRSALLGPLCWTTSLRPRLEEVEHKMRNRRNPYTDSASPLNLVSLNLRLYMVIFQDFRNGSRCAVKEVHSNGDDIAVDFLNSTPGAIAKVLKDHHVKA